MCLRLGVGRQWGLDLIRICSRLHRQRVKKFILEAEVFKNGVSFSGTRLHQGWGASLATYFKAWRVKGTQNGQEEEARDYWKGITARKGYVHEQTKTN